MGCPIGEGAERPVGGSGLATPVEVPALLWLRVAGGLEQCVACGRAESCSHGDSLGTQQSLKGGFIQHILWVRHLVSRRGHPWVDSIPRGRQDSCPHFADKASITRPQGY